MRVSCQRAIGTTDGQSPTTRRTQLAQERRSSSDATTGRVNMATTVSKKSEAVQHQHSMRLNDQWRLIFELEGKKAAKVIAIVAIEDYH